MDTFSQPGCASVAHGGTLKLVQTNIIQCDEKRLSGSRDIAFRKSILSNFGLLYPLYLLAINLLVVSGLQFKKEIIDLLLKRMACKRSLDDSRCLIL